ncbi:MAG: tyrosine--tRNA ligase [Cyclobacteriaceae bacterium]|nr:tyrosine--tRNA ligase [Cyclobacteriaceae bacterium]
MSDFIKELTWRGMIHDIMPGTEDLLKKGVISGYIGFDPTADSLHIGSLVPIMMLVHFQRAGHKPIALVGGATGMVGDPSGRSTERQLLSEEEIRNNLEGIRRQLEKFLDFKSVENAAEIVNNYDWFKDFYLLDFIRDIGKHVTVNYMMAKESVKKRLEIGMSFTEFTYQLIQGYDFYWLHRNKNVKLQMGGSDQWGNIVTGTELIRRKDGGDAFALTTPLIKKADGTKFGKTEEGNVWLDPEKTSPYKFYQYWMNSSDEDAAGYIRIFTLIDRETIEEIEKQHAMAPHKRPLQKALAEDITVRVHSREDYNMALRASIILFGRSTTEELKSIDERTLLAVFEGVPQCRISRDKYNAVENVTELLSTSTDGIIFQSKGEARRMIQGGGVNINKSRISEPTDKVSYSLLNDKYMLIQKGKKNYYLLIIE